MKSVDQYFSIVDDRIEELKRKLEIAKHKSNYTSSPRAYRRHRLECEMLERKINYLKKLTKLPLLYAIENLPAEDLAKLQLSESGSKEELIKLFQLEKLSKYAKSPKIVTLAYIKDAFMGDFDAMLSLLEMNQKNHELTNKKQKLYGVGLDGSNSYLKVSFDERALNRDEKKIEDAIAEMENSFNMTSLREIYGYMHNKDQKLSYEFILKHSDKILAKNPEMEKTIKKLKRKKHFGWLNRILPLKRNKEEHKFMAAILDYYNNNDAINTLGISSVNIFDMSDKELREFVKYTKGQSAKKRLDIANRRNKIAEARKEVLRQVQACNLEQDQERKRFVDLVHTKTNFLPKMFEEQLWNEPALKDSILLESCYLEEKMIMEQLQSALQTAISPIEIRQLEQPKTVAKEKKLVA